MRLKLLIGLLLSASVAYGLEVKSSGGGISSAEVAADYVQKAGDTMTGTLTNKPGSAVTGLFINQDNAAKSLDIDSEATGAGGVSAVLMSLQHTQDNAIQISNAAANAGTLFFLREDHTGSTGSAFKVQQDGTGAILDLNANTSSGTIKMDGAFGACMHMRDTDDGGWTSCTFLNGTMTCFDDDNLDCSAT